MAREGFGDLKRPPTHSHKKTTEHTDERQLTPGTFGGLCD
jgi:hypothetical protein